MRRVQRTTNGTGTLSNYTIDKLKQLDAGYNWTADEGKSYAFRGQGITIPTLEEVFAALPEMEMTIEIEETDRAGIDAFCEAIRRDNMVDQVTVASIDTGVLRHFRSVCPEVTSAAALPEVLSFYLLDRMDWLTCIVHPPKSWRSLNLGDHSPFPV